MIPNIDRSGLESDLETERTYRRRNHTSIHITNADIEWLDRLANEYGTNRSAVARLVISRTRATWEGTK